MKKRYKALQSSWKKGFLIWSNAILNVKDLLNTHTHMHTYILIWDKCAHTFSSSTRMMTLFIVPKRISEIVRKWRKMNAQIETYNQSQANSIQRACAHTDMHKIIFIWSWRNCEHRNEMNRRRRGDMDGFEAKIWSTARKPPSEKWHVSL